MRSQEVPYIGVGITRTDEKRLDASREVMAALESLPAAQREVLYLHTVNELSG